MLEIPKIFNFLYKNNSNAKLLIVGKDTVDYESGRSTWRMMEEQLDPAARRNVSYLGAKRYSEIQQIIKRAKVCIFPSMAETFGLVTAESMAMGKAVIATCSRGIEEFIEDSVTGFWVPPANPMLLRSKILLLWENPRLAKEMGSRARASVRSRVDMNRLVNELASIVTGVHSH